MIGELTSALDHFAECLSAAWSHGDVSFIRSGVLGVGIVATRLRADAHAAWLFGASTALLATRGGRQFRWIERQAEAALDTTCTRLTTFECSRLWEAGRIYVTERGAPERSAIVAIIDELRIALVAGLFVSIGSGRDTA